MERGGEGKTRAQGDEYPEAWGKPEGGEHQSCPMPATSARIPASTQGQTREDSCGLLEEVTHTPAHMGGNIIQPDTRKAQKRKVLLERAPFPFIKSC